MDYEIKTPQQCSEDEINEFYKLIELGGQVSLHGLKNRIIASDFLAFCKEDGKTVGVASMKNPNLGYKSSVFEKAGKESDATSYTYEIGYAFTSPDYRGKKINQKLMQLLIEQVEGENLYATTKTDSMRHILSKLGFSKHGKDYPNDKSEMLSLFVFDRL